MHARQIGAAVLVLSSVTGFLGCSDNSSTAPSDGSLLLTITGLPVGVSASVTITGPASFNQTITASQYLANLPPGAYAVTANIVSQGTTTYGGTPPAQVVSVLASTMAATASVSYSAMTGQLAVTVSGTPGGLNPSVLVTGPFAFSQSITTTGTSTFTPLPLGTYTVTGSDVSNASMTYWPSPMSQNVTMNSGALYQTATVTYASLGHWTAVASLPTPRAALGTATLNGVLYAVGGYETNTAMQLATVEAYDPTTDSWSTRASMKTARVSLAVAVIGGSIYAVGGYNGVTQVSTLEAYDPSTNTWTTKAPMPTARSGLAAAVVNGVLYAIGGEDAAGTLLATVEAYEPTTDTWSAKASMPAGRRGLAAAVLGNTLYAIHQVSLYAYDPSTNTWTTKAPPRPGLALAAGVINGLPYRVGGVVTGPGVVVALPTVEAYDPASDSWSDKARMPTARWALGVAVVSSTLYAVGGYSSANGGNIALSVVEAYTP